MDYKEKYIKYKNKYLQLKNQLRGGEYIAIPETPISVPSSFFDNYFLKKLFLEPVVAADGYTYEKESIEEWLKSNETSPKTRALLVSKILIPNNALKRAISEMIVDRAKFPKSFFCSLTKKKFKDPVITADGETYEREYIKNWFSYGHKISPYTGLKLINQTLLDNFAIKSAIDEINIETKQKPYYIDALIAWPMFLYGFQTSRKQLKTFNSHFNDNLKIPPFTMPIQLSLMTRMRLITNGLCAMLVRKLFILDHTSFAKIKYIILGRHILSRVYAYNSSAKCVATLDGHDTTVVSVAFHPRAPVLATCGGDYTARLWNPLPDNLSSDIKCVETLRGHRSHVLSVAFHPILPLLATGSDDKTVKLWELRHNLSAKCMATLEGHVGIVTSVAFHPILPLLATGSGDNTAKLWQISPDYSSAKCVATLKEHRYAVNSVAFHPTAPLLATGSNDYTAKLWRISPDYSSAACVATLIDHDNPVLSVTFHPTAPLLATGSTDHTVKLWQISSDNWSVECVATLQGHSSDVNSVVFHPTAPLLATGSSDNTAKLWRLSLDRSSTECVATLKGHSNVVRSVAFHPIAPLLATGSADKFIKLWR
jgi:WD40 repeat protein